ncbi:MAG TPA: VTT domain-containing protein [Anaerolineales bacterium]|nr:VTT domain-containing protein [Anaerolineales bacterium]
MTFSPGVRRAGVALARVGALVACIGISIFIFSIRDQTASLAAYGLPGIFLLSLISNATIILPAPGFALTFALGGVMSPGAVALAAGAGAALGELTGYLAGYSGQSIAERTAIYPTLEAWTRRYGGLAILALAFVPNPFFDIAGASAGMLRMPIPAFLFWTWIGKTLKMLVIAYAGAASLDWIEAWIPPAAP